MLKRKTKTRKIRLHLTRMMIKMKDQMKKETKIKRMDKMEEYKNKAVTQIGRIMIQVSFRQ